MSISFFFSFKMENNIELSKNFSRNFQLRNLTLNLTNSESTWQWYIQVCSVAEWFRALVL